MTFQKMRPLFWLFYKLHRVPKSFYMKYCFPHKGQAFRGHDQPQIKPVPTTATHNSDL